jgi:hypothetical protein
MDPKLTNRKAKQPSIQNLNLIAHKESFKGHGARNFFVLKTKTPSLVPHINQCTSLVIFINSEDQSLRGYHSVSTDKVLPTFVGTHCFHLQGVAVK